MFKAREIYCETGRIPKNMIWYWEEKRLIFIILPIMIALSSALIIYGLHSPDWDEN
jgi:multisubunit Na+/H+ antiporter MnhB subunit